MNNVTPIGRASFPQLFAPSQINGEGAEKYNLTLVFEPDAKGLKELEETIDGFIQKKYNGKLPKNFKHPILHGDELDRPEYKGKVVIRLSARADKTKPKVFNRDKTLMTSPSDFYSGCNCRATFGLYAWEYMGKSGVSFGLNDVQFVSHNDRFDGRPTVDAFDDLPEEDLADLPY